MLNGGLEAGRAARRAVVAGEGELPPAVCDDVLLLVTELVTNAVRHADIGPDEALRVELRRWSTRVRVEVMHPGDEFTEERARRSRSGAGGWGLELIDQIAARWGVGRAGSGTCVWFELEFAG